MKSMSVTLLIVLLSMMVLGACAPSAAEPEDETPLPTHTPLPTDPPTNEPEPTPTPTGEEPVTHSDEPRLPSNATPAELAELAAGNSVFALQLFQALNSRSGNIFFSPYSISAALAMTYAGARSETEQQMAETLRFTLAQDRLHPTFNALDTNLMAAEGEDAFQLNVANAIWGQQGFQFLPEFLDTLAQNYGAGLRPLDFVGDTEGARVTINDWVSEETEEKIQDLIPQGALSSDTRLVLSNAIYFNGKWVLAFDPNNTHDQPFYLLDGSQVELPMMSEMDQYRYTAGDAYQAIELPYRDSEMSMLLVLPALDRYDEIEATFSAEMLDTILTNLAYRQVQFSLPKFGFESEFSLEQILGEMGMPAAFGSGADFSGMTGGRDLFISKVLHKAFVAVDEEGTEAAAATAVVMELTSAMPEEDPVVMKLDHPFLFLIRDNATGTILFAGRVLDPSQ